MYLVSPPPQTRPTSPHSASSGQPHDGPVGRLLVKTGRHPWRAAHIHAKVSATGFETLTTYLFDRESRYLDSDTVFGVKESLIKDFARGADETLLCEHDFVLRREPQAAPLH